jgi:uncharacterized phage-like protein YoqJ
VAVEKALAEFCKNYSKGFIILGAGATGVDDVVKDWCDKQGVRHVLFKPYHMIDNKAEFAPRMFLARNRQLVDNADAVLIFTNGEDGGMKNMQQYAEKKNKSLTVKTLP